MFAVIIIVTCVYSVTESNDFSRVAVRTVKKARIGFEAVRTFKGLRLQHVNIRSLVPKWEEVSNTIFKCDLDVIIFTETWLHDKVHDALISHPDYILYRLDRLFNLECKY